MEQKPLMYGEYTNFAFAFFPKYIGQEKLDEEKRHSNLGSVYTRMPCL